MEHLGRQRRDREKPLRIDALQDPPPERRIRVVAEIEPVVLEDAFGQEPDFELLELASPWVGFVERERHSGLRGFEGTELRSAKPRNPATPQPHRYSHTRNNDTNC